MIRIQLWRGDRLVTEHDRETEREADQVIDLLLTDIHAGKHGHGDFTVEADHRDHRGVFVGSYWRASEISALEKTASE